MDEHGPKKPIGSTSCLSCLSRAKPRGASRTHAICLEHHSFRAERAYVGWFQRSSAHPPAQSALSAGTQTFWTVQDTPRKC
jgi:hypothetical protein